MDGSKKRKQGQRVSPNPKVKEKPFFLVGREGNKKCARRILPHCSLEGGLLSFRGKQYSKREGLTCRHKIVDATHQQKSYKLQKDRFFLGFLYPTRILSSRTLPSRVLWVTQWNRAQTIQRLKYHQSYQGSRSADPSFRPSCFYFTRICGGETKNPQYAYSFPYGRVVRGKTFTNS